MLVWSKREEYDGSHRVVLYEMDEDGRCVPTLSKVEYDDQIDTFYIQRQKELERLLADVMEERISPVSFFMQLQNMNLRDVASRMRISVGRARKHMTREGFDGIKVGMLRRYARMFGVTVADLFTFTQVTEDVDVEVTHSGDRLVSRITITVKDR
jgi:hypothetical protein